MKSTIPEAWERLCKDLSGSEEASAVNVGCLMLSLPIVNSAAVFQTKTETAQSACLSHFHLPSITWAPSPPFPELTRSCRMAGGHTPD